MRDSWGLVQGMMTEQDSLSSPVHIPVACLPPIGPSPSFCSLQPTHVQATPPSHPICLLILTPSLPTPHGLRDPYSPQCLGHTLILHPPLSPGKGSTHGIIPRLPKGETEAREVGWGKGKAEVLTSLSPQMQPVGSPLCPPSPLLFSSPGHRPSQHHS